VGRRYQLAYGERRLRAAQIAGLTTLPIQVRELNDEQMLEISLTENIQREDLHPLDEARAYARLQEELGYSVREIAAKVGKGKSYVATLLSLLRYPDVEQAVRSAAIPVRTAEELAKIKNPDERRRLTNQVIAGNLDRQGLIDARQQKTRARQPAQVADTPVHTSEKPARSAPSLRAEGEAEPIQVPDERHPPTDQNITGDPDRQSPMALHEPRTKTDTPVRTADTPPVIQVFNHAFQVLETQTAAQIPPEAHQAVATILKQIIERATTLLEELQIRAI
jgi:ParB-like chromosome segregation protein Spo0J